MRFFPLLFAISIIVCGCKKPEGCTDPGAANYDNDAVLDDGSCLYKYCPGCSQGAQVYGSIYSNTTWTSNCVYVLNGKVVVQPGVTLTIEPGTIIKGAEGTGTLAAALVIAKGATLNACGTDSQPIIFTSILDNIHQGELTGTNLTENDHGLWGGLIIMGSAPISASSGDTQAQALFLPSDPTWNFYGGNDPLDNSGSLCYVSIRHTGALIGAGQEAAALTLAGVGSGTQISNIEVITGTDDGLDIYGGTVNINNAFVGFMDDDGIDLDQNYDGNISNFTVCYGTGDEGLEADGPEGITYVDGSFNLTNGTFINVGTALGHHQFKNNAQGVISNVDFDGSLEFETAYDASCTQLDISCLKRLLDNPATLNFNAINRTILEYRIVSQNGCSVTAAHQNEAETKAASGNPTGNGNTDHLWTWLFQKGYL